MKIIYVANIRLPTEKAHGLQIMKMCGAFAAQTNGVGNGKVSGAEKNEVRLLAPRRPNKIAEDAFAYYGARRIFSVVFLPALPPVFGFRASNLSFAVSAFFWALRHKTEDTVFYGRDGLALLLLSFLDNPVFWEVHNVPRRFFRFWSAAARRFNGLVSTNRWKAEFLRKNLGLPPEKIFVSPNAFDPEEFSGLPSKNECRRILGLPEKTFIALYAGHLYDWKGGGVILEAAGIFSGERGFSSFKPLLVFVGGTEEDAESFRKKAGNLENVFIVGQRPHREIPLWLCAADALILPNSAVFEESVRATSPLKLFEYMASRRPIVASDLPSVREIVSEKEVLFFAPDNPRALAGAVKKIFANRNLAKNLAERAEILSRRRGWNERAKKIMKFIYERRGA